MPEKKVSQYDFVKAYFMQRPNEPIPHSESKKEIEGSWYTLTGKRMEDSDRAIRKLHGEGFLVKVKKGVYMYDPSYVHKREDNDFSAADKQVILERDNYKCVICGASANEGWEMHIDHIKPRSLGGTNEKSNGQVLCSRHNFFKKNLSQTEVGKKFFVNLLENIKQSEPSEYKSTLEAFVLAVLEQYEKYNIDSHIENPTE